MRYVAVLVDKEVGLIVGWLYFLTYSFTFTGLTTTIGTLVDDLGFSRSASIMLTCASVTIPILVNLTDIRVFKKVEFFLGFLKVTLAVFTISILIWINSDVGNFGRTSLVPREILFPDAGRFGPWGALCIAALYSSFAFVGVEAVAATSMEADFHSYTQEPNSSHSRGGTDEDQRNLQHDSYRPAIKDPFSRPAALVPIIATLLYTFGAYFVTANVAWNDGRLPNLSGTSPSPAVEGGGSIFLIAAGDWSPGLEKSLNAFIIVNVASTSSTALYIASRSLFGLALVLSGHFEGTADIPNRSPLEKGFCWLVRKNRFHVPQRAVLVSGLWTVCIPFFRYIWPGAIQQVSWMIFSTRFHYSYLSLQHVSSKWNWSVLTIRWLILLSKWAPIAAYWSGGVWRLLLGV